MAQDKPALIHHAAMNGNHYFPGSLEALGSCIDGGAQIVEVDIIPLAGGDFALFHNDRLEASTDGSGPVIHRTASQIKAMHYFWQGKDTGQCIGLLSQVIPLIAKAPRLQTLQLDLKPYAPLRDVVLANLLALIAPVKDRILVSSTADWGIRRLRELDPTLALGFDPLLYLDVNVGETRPQNIPPFRAGAYGYLDDHPLSAQTWGQTSEYLTARAGVLCAQVPGGLTWFIRAALLLQATEDGFNWVRFLHAHHSLVAAWTLDVGEPRQIVAAGRLVKAGVDFITTNTAAQLARSLTTPVRY